MSRFVRFEGANTAVFNVEHINSVKFRRMSFHLSLEEWKPWAIYLVSGLYPKGFPVISFREDEIEKAKNYFFKVDKFITSTESLRDTSKNSEKTLIRFSNGRYYVIEKVVIIRVADRTKYSQSGEKESYNANIFKSDVEQFAVILEFSDKRPAEVIASFKTKEEAISYLDSVLDMLNKYDKVSIKESEELLPNKTSEELSESVSETGKTTENADNILTKEPLEDLSQISTEALIEELKKRNIKVFKKKKDFQRTEL